jgi:hypothetical protein
MGANTAPVIMLVFNRPESARTVLDQIRPARPETLLVVADGPRPDRPADQEACAKVRAVIKSGANWDVRVLTNYADTNLGLRRRFSSGLDWAFQQVDHAIVLEDDCVPHPTFFRYCTDLLDHYRDDDRVGVVSGDNFQPRPFDCGASYYFSRYPHCWGWATWRRAWNRFDAKMANWPALRAARWLDGLFHDPLHAAYWENIFDGVHAGRINTWDYAWTFSCWSQHFLTVLPNVNLVKNIGTGAEATNTKDKDSNMHHLAVGQMEFPLQHPAVMVRNQQADDYSQRNIFGAAKSTTLLGRARRLVKKCLPGRR